MFSGAGDTTPQSWALAELAAEVAAAVVRVTANAANAVVRVVRERTELRELWVALGREFMQIRRRVGGDWFPGFAILFGEWVLRPRMERCDFDRR
jgi:hypothetical protein